MINNNGKSKTVVHAMMGVDNSVSLERPDFENIHVVFWKRADVAILWPEGMTPKEAIISWALTQIKNKEGEEK